MKGYRKMIVMLATIVAVVLLAAFKVMDGGNVAAVLTVCVPVYLGGSAFERHAQAKAEETKALAQGPTNG